MRAPFAFMLCLLVGAAVAWTAADWAYRKQIDALREQVKVKDAEIELAKYKMSLSKDSDSELVRELHRLVNVLTTQPQAVQWNPGPQSMKVVDPTTAQQVEAAAKEAAARLHIPIQLTGFKEDDALELARLRNQLEQQR
jgi:hypothetical protein